MPGGDVIPPGRSPAQAIAAWPGSARLTALTSGSTPGRHARWTILTAPTECRSGYPAAVELPLPKSGSDTGADPVPFIGGWIGWIPYEAGALIEPASTDPINASPLQDWPLACFLRCPGAYVHDARDNRWRTVGDAGSLPALDWDQAEAVLAGEGACEVGPLISRSGHDRYTRDAASVIELIHAGDAFQVNLAHQLTGRFRGDARRCFLDLIGAASPWFGAYIERPDGLGAICSLSPELFLEADLRRRSVLTRPIKGTRPGSCAEADLRSSAKDAAELAMIVDLMRNDLGRVCEFGSVRVTDPQRIERHAGSESRGRSTGVLHGVATIEGRLRRGVRLCELLEATFPPGSVTGAPKVRAMQIINEFESLPRGPYCGAIGFVSDSGCVELSVAIRTASILGRRSDPEHRGAFDGRIVFPVGAGLVADSDPESEWQETLDKAAAFVRAMDAVSGTPVPKAPSK